MNSFNRTTLASAIIIALSFSAPLTAQDSSTSEEDSIERILVKIGRMPSDLGSVPHSVTLLSEEDISEQSKITTDLGAMLAQKVPGLVASSSSGSNFNQTLRGRKPAVLIDGVLIGTPLRDSGRELRTISPSAIGSIEVIRGSSSVYGSGGAGGVINYITKTPSQDEFEAYVTLGYGGSLTEFEDSDTYRAELFLSGKPNKFDYIVSASYDDVGLFYDAEGDLISPDPGGQGGISDTSIESLFVKLGYDIDDDQRITLSATTYESKQDVEYRIDLANLGNRSAADSSQRIKQVGVRWDDAYYAAQDAVIQDELNGISETIFGLTEQVFGVGIPIPLFAYPDAGGTEGDRRALPTVTDNTVVTLTYENFETFLDSTFSATLFYQEVDNRFGYSTLFEEKVNPIQAALNAGTIDAATAELYELLYVTFNGPVGNFNEFFGRHSFFRPEDLDALASATGVTDTNDYIRGGQSATQSEKYGLRLDFVTPLFDVLKGGQVLWGLDFGNDETVQPLENDTRNFTPLMDLTSFAVFSQLELDINDSFTLRAGFRYEDASVEIPDFVSLFTGNDITGADLDYDEVLFNFGGVYALTNEISLFGGFSQGFIVTDIGSIVRAFDLDQTNGQPNGQSDVGVLDPEAQVIDNYELGIRGIYEDFSWSFAVYQSESDNGTDLDPVTFQATQAPEEIWGYELTFDYSITDTLEVGGSYSYVDGEVEREFTDESGVTTKFDEPITGFRISPPKATFYVDWNFTDDWYVRTQALYSESDDRFTSIPLEERLDGQLPFESFLLTDIVVSGSISDAASLSFAVQNALNEDYFTLESDNQIDGIVQAKGPGRSFMVTYTHRFE